MIKSLYLPVKYNHEVTMDLDDIEKDQNRMKYPNNPNYRYYSDEFYNICTSICKYSVVGGTIRRMFHLIIVFQQQFSFIILLMDN